MPEDDIENDRLGLIRSIIIALPIAAVLWGGIYALIVWVK